MRFPLSLTFKVITFAQEVTVADATGQTVAYVKQKAFKLKEDIQVFTDASQSQLLYTIKADRIIDFSARYHFADATGNALGSIQRDGVKSLWQSRYAIADAAGRTVFTVTEANPWVKVADALVSEIPVLGMFTGYFLHPAYDLATPDGAISLRLEKQPSFIGRRFAIHEVVDAPVDDEVRGLLGMILVVLLERNRG